MEKWYNGEKIGSGSGNGILTHEGVSFQRHSLGWLLGSLAFILFCCVGVLVVGWFIFSLF